jgi:carbamoyl-phosphate synthase large subunit
MKVLFTNVGRRTYMVEFVLNLIGESYPIELHVSDCTLISAAMHVSSKVKVHLLPQVLENPEYYLHNLLALCKREQFEVIFPLSDLDTLLLSKFHQEFERIGCRVIVSDQRTIERCNDKRLTHEICRATGIPTPNAWFSSSDYDGTFPVIQKHIFGSGSSGLKVLERSSDLENFVSGQDMLQQLIIGDEFGLDILNDLKGNLVAVCAKRKLSMRSGETDKAEIIVDPELLDLGKRISNMFRHVGNLDCDILRNKQGELFCIDFNPRFGGGYPATHLAGFNYIKAVLDMVQKRPYSLPQYPKMVTVIKGISLYSCNSKEV